MPTPSSNIHPLVLDTLNGHTLTIVDTGDGVTLRIAKDGHNRAIAKLSGTDALVVSAYLAPSI